MNCHHVVSLNHCCTPYSHCCHTSVCSVCGRCYSCGVYIGVHHHCYPYVWPYPHVTPWGTVNAPHVIYTNKVTVVSPTREAINTLAGARSA